MTHPYTRRDILKQGALAAAMAINPLFAFGQALENAVDRANLSSRPTDLRITDVKCGFIRGGAGLFVKIHTNQGIWGCGEGVTQTLIGHLQNHSNFKNCCLFNNEDNRNRKKKLILVINFIF